MSNFNIKTRLSPNYHIHRVIEITKGADAELLIDFTKYGEFWNENKFNGIKKITCIFKQDSTPLVFEALDDNGNLTEKFKYYDDILYLQLAAADTNRFNETYRGAPTLWEVVIIAPAGLDGLSEITTINRQTPIIVKGSLYSMYGLAPTQE